MNQDAVIVTATLRAKAGKEDALKVLLERAIKDSAHHKGLLFYSVQQNRQVPAEFIFLENFASQQDLDAHLAELGNMPVFAEIAELLDGEAKIDTWTSIAYTGGIGER